MKAASPFYFILVKIKCFLSQKEGLNLRQNKKITTSRYQNYLHSLVISKTEISEHHGPFGQKWGAGYPKINITGLLCCCGWEVDPFSSPWKKISLCRTMMVLWVGHASLHTSQRPSLNYPLPTQRIMARFRSPKISTWGECRGGTLRGSL